MPLLEVKDLHVKIGPIHILKGISLKISRGETICIIGPNGAGRTTLIKAIMGLLPVSSGIILFDGKDITNLPPYERAKLGIGYMPEDRGLITSLTVYENFLIVQQAMKLKSLPLDTIYEIFPETKRLLNRKALYLSGGEGKIVAIARALLLSPKLLLLDEPLEGLAPIIVERLAKSFAKIKRLGVSILFSESKIANAKKVADRIYFMDRGEITSSMHGAAMKEM